VAVFRQPTFFAHISRGRVAVFRQPIFFAHISRGRVAVFRQPISRGRMMTKKGWPPTVTPLERIFQKPYLAIFT